MFTLIALIAFSLGFVYVDWQMSQNYWTARTCSNRDRIRGPNMPGAICPIILLAFFIALVAWASWGATDNPYHRQGIWYVHAGDEYATCLLLMLAFCVGYLQMPDTPTLTGQRYRRILDTYDDPATPAITDLQRARAAIEYLMFIAQERYVYTKAEVREPEGTTVWTGGLDTSSHEIIQNTLVVTPTGKWIM